MVAAGVEGSSSSSSSSSEGGTTVSASAAGSRSGYSYIYPRNLVSWFFLAQRHKYVRKTLHNSRNLDLGCSVHKITADSIGADLRAAKRPDLVCSVLNLPFIDRSFDTCTMLEVIEHMDTARQEQALGEVRRVLQDDGQFIMSTPNLVYGVFRLVWWFWERTVGKEWFHEHVGMLNPDQIQELLHSAGFVTVRSKRIAVFDRIFDTRKS